MKKIFIIITILSLFPNLTRAEINLATKLSGRILLQTEAKGEAWYVNPGDNRRYFLGRPCNAFILIKRLGIGISNKDLDRIGSDAIFTKKQLGKIFIQIEKNGEAWYVNPSDQKKYYLSKPEDTLTIMRTLSLGISNNNIYTIPVGGFNDETKTPVLPLTQTNEDVISLAASAIRSNNKEVAVTYFSPEVKKLVEYSLGFLNNEGRLTLGNMLSGSRLESATETKKVYLNEVYFNGEKIPVRVNVEKINDKWLITNL